MTEGRAAAASSSRINLGETTKGVMMAGRGFLALFPVRGEKQVDTREASFEFN